MPGEQVRHLRQQGPLTERATRRLELQGRDARGVAKEGRAAGCLGGPGGRVRGKGGSAGAGTGQARRHLRTQRRDLGGEAGLALAWPTARAPGLACGTPHSWDWCVCVPAAASTPRGRAPPETPRDTAAAPPPPNGAASAGSAAGAGTRRGGKGKGGHTRQLWTGPGGGVGRRRRSGGSRGGRGPRSSPRSRARRRCRGGWKGVGGWSSEERWGE